MPSPVRQPNRLEKSATAFPKASYPKFATELSRVRQTNELAAFSFEFVAKPEQAADATLLLPAAIQSGLEDVAGFAGSFVMVSDQEARLITVIVFWEGCEARRTGPQVARRVRALLAPYLDRCLRVQNLLAYFPARQGAFSQQDAFSQASSIDTSLIAEESIAEEATICAA